MICIPITETTTEKAIAGLKKAAKLADIVELRIDYIKGINEKNLLRLLKNKNVKVIVTNRKKSEGGKSNLDEKSRINLLEKSIEFGADFVDIEFSANKKIIEKLIKNKNNAKIICSYHDFKKTPKNLFRIYNNIKKTNCDIIKIVTHANSIADNFVIFDLLKKTGKPIIAFCMGEFGQISRVLALKYGSFLTFAPLADGKGSAPGQIAAKELIKSYKIKKVNTDTKIIGIIGNPVEHSFSPLMHNTAFNILNLNYIYLKLKVDDLGTFMKGFKHYFYGASVTIPHKVEIMKYLDGIDKQAKKIGAVNTIVNKNGRFIGYNTDCGGAMNALKEKTALRNKRAVMLGSGGAARAIGYGLKNEGANIIILNRTLQKAKLLARELKCGFNGLSHIKDIDFDILINTTSIGMRPNVNQSLVGKKYLKNKVVLDIVYNPKKTRLLKDAENMGSKIISGVEMFINQAALQFRLWTGKSAPISKMREAIMKSLK